MHPNQSHRLVAIDTWPDITPDGFGFVSGAWSCACGDHQWAQTGGRTLAEAREAVERWHDIHVQIEVGKWPRLYRGLRRLPPRRFREQFPYLPDPVRAASVESAILAVEAGDPAYARIAGVL